MQAALFDVLPGAFAYRASEHGGCGTERAVARPRWRVIVPRMLGFTKALAREVSGQGVLVNAIAPGPVTTPLIDELSPE